MITPRRFVWLATLVRAGLPASNAVGGIICILIALAPVARAQAEEGFSSSNVQAKYGEFPEPDIVEDVPKSLLTFENAAAGGYWSSYLFVDVVRSWSEADANAKEVYGEWYPSLSIRKFSGQEPYKGFVRDVSVTLGLNSGVRSTGPAPFVLLPGVTAYLSLPKFAFASVGVFAYIDRGRFQGQPAGCQGMTFQITPSWSLPFQVGGAKLKLDGFADFIGSHAACDAQFLTQPRLVVDLSNLWNTPGRVFVGVDFSYWHNKYGIRGFEQRVFLPVVIWVL